MPIIVVSASICFWSNLALAQQASPCTVQDTPSENLLGCVRSLLENNEKDVLSEQVQGLLRKLAETSGYRGEISDLNELKRRSVELKRDPYAHHEAINLLDSAIASHVDEIGPAVSAQALAQLSEIGTDIYAKFVRQKLTFLGSEKAKFYDGGPFEIVWRSLLASALESQYFLEQKTGEGDKRNLRTAIQTLDEIIDRRTRPEYAYLTNRQSALISSDLFWRASLLIALGDRSETQKILRKLVLDNKDFELNVAASRHIYVYKIFNFPHQIFVQNDSKKDGLRKVEVKDPDLLDRYYNAAQLALYSCSYLDQVGSAKGIPTFVAAIENLELSDYYVVAATADNSAKIQESATLLKQKLSNQAILNALDQLRYQVASKEAPGFSEAIKRGALACDIKEDVRDQIYSKFEIQPSIVHIEGLGKATEYLVVGGRLNVNQAGVVAEFLNKTATIHASEAHDASQGNETRAYPARMRISQ
jgi:hypothetical protein